MPVADFLKKVLLYPGILRPYKQILLVSHMRANTSLLGHLLGSNPEIEGYYELHMGYYSWKSFVRQKMLYFSKHTPKPGGRFIFDKILHDDHDINMALMKDAKLIFALRSPHRTIKSIISLYRQVDPDHRYACGEGATNYYITRLTSMRKLAKDIPADFLYLDSDALRSSTQSTLKTISGYLGLKQDLEENYDIQILTGETRVGDSSELINRGTVEKQMGDYSDVQLSDDMLDTAMAEYRVTRSFLLAHERCSVKVMNDS